MIRIKSNKIITEDGILDGYLYVDAGKIRELSKAAAPCDEEYDFTGKYVSAGFIDIHTHGAGGNSFMTDSADEVTRGCAHHMRHGTTTILPTVSACSYETMRASVISIKEAMKSDDAPCNILGAHLEGPYLSKNQCGAQNPELITPPIKDDYEALVREHGDAIARWTYAPERDEGGEFARFITTHGILASAGHSDAKYPDMDVAIKNGCNLVTHLYSSTSTVTRDHGFRSLGIIESAFLRDDLFVEIIADGKHLPPELIKMIIKIKGIDKVALITDSLDIAGTDIKEGVMSGIEFIVEDGVCKLKDRTAFAGSIATANMLIRTLVFECGFSVKDAVSMLTVTPAKILGLDSKGKLAEGFDADICVFDDCISVSDVFVGGRKVI